MKKEQLKDLIPRIGMMETVHDPIISTRLFIEIDSAKTAEGNIILKTRNKVVIPKKCAILIGLVNEDPLVVCKEIVLHRETGTFYLTENKSIAKESNVELMKRIIEISTGEIHSNPEQHFQVLMPKPVYLQITYIMRTQYKAPRFRQLYH